MTADCRRKRRSGSEPEAFLYRSIASQHEDGILLRKARIRRNGKIDLTAFFQSHDIDTVFLPDIEIAHRLSDPAGRYGNFHDGVFFIEFDVVENMI